MERKVSLEEISDGKLYGSNDLVKADCGDCSGCSACCRGMGSSILLDPYDIMRMTGGLHMQFNQLLADYMELNVVDYMILPNLKMSGGDERCGFLDDRGRCSIHPIRPGFCRLFPLGRVYEDRSFRYFLQVHECPRENRTKVKVRRWVDTPDFKAYERFVADWHYFLKDSQEMLKASGNENLARQFNLYLLNCFFVTPYRAQEDFYPQFYARLAEAKQQML